MSLEKPNRVSAYDTATGSREGAIKGKATPSFGMDGKSTAVWLRDMAYQIEQGEYVLHKATVLTKAQAEEYCTTYVRLQFHEKLKG